MAALFVNHRKVEEFRHTAHVQNMLDNEMYARYRYTNGGIDYLEDLLKESLERTTRRNRALTVRQMILITLRFFATGAFFNIIGDSMGYHKCTVSRVVAQVTEAICGHIHQFVTWPDANARAWNMTEYFKKAGFPNVVGCVDGTHIRIQAPSEDEPAFVNRKGFHSINMQAVCDFTGKFTSVNASWPGSCHDAHVFRTSGLAAKLTIEHVAFSDGVLLGDSGYALKPFLMTPFIRVDSEAKERYQQAHTRTRACIERAFGRLKRFHVLHSEIRLRPEKACKVAVACVILHNIAVDMNIPMDDDEFIQPQNGNDGVHQDGGTGVATRDFIVENFFSV
ncbi:putative nuclease HARBI1 [Mya arenaria]|uniref:putative nuclease HARBI1 n=1 Tax=Mya arenaria TaxID=6604 RepID=UPI0022E7D34D|nr:putative nuclease HARBI1 [Mya arenaria]